MNSQPNDDKYKNSESVVLSLESLNAQYTNVLIEYRQAVTNYVAFLKDDTKVMTNQNEYCEEWAARGECKNNPAYMLNSCAKSCNVKPVRQMVTVPNAAYWGESAISLNNSSTLQECSASCASASGCSGATYNQTAHGQPMCWLRGGDSNITAGMDSDYAIVPEGKQLLLTVQMLNQRLSDINTQIQTITKNGQSDYDSQSIERKQNTANLVKQFIILNEEREKIEQAINDYQTVDQQQISGGLIANKNYFSFILLLLLAIMIIFVLYQFGFSTITQQTSSVLQSGGKVYSPWYFVTGISILFIAFVFIYNSNFNKMINS
jgi:hypothetical protein